MKNKTKIKILGTIGVIFSLLSFTFADTNIEINSSLDSGIYNKVIKIDLKVSKENVKIFWSFNPDSTPNDLLEYTGTILIKKSTPLVFFAVENYQSESKIIEKNYEIKYNSGIIFDVNSIKYEDGKIKSLALKNNSFEEIDLSYWQIKTNSETKELEEGIIANSGAILNFDNGIKYETGNIELISPDGNQIDSILPNFIGKNIENKEIKITEPVKETKPIIKNIEPKKNKQVKENKPIIEETTTIEKEHITQNTEEIKRIENLSKPEEIKETNSGQINENPQISNEEKKSVEDFQKTEENLKNNENNKNLNDNLKSSIVDKKNNLNPIFILIIFSLLGVAFTINFILLHNKKVKK